jgi:hypothetical protein
MSIQPRQQTPEQKPPPTMEETLADHGRKIAALLEHTGLDGRFDEGGTLEITNPE